LRFHNASLYFTGAGTIPRNLTKEKTTVKKILLAVFAIGLGTAALAVQINHDRNAAPKLLATDAPEPDCLPNCDLQ